jgi:hypothetical protein
MRNHRCRRAAELAGASGEGDVTTRPLTQWGHHFGFHSRASFCASAICAGVIFAATRFRLSACGVREEFGTDAFIYKCAPFDQRIDAVFDEIIAMPIRNSGRHSSGMRVRGDGVGRHSHPGPHPPAHTLSRG